MHSTLQKTAKKNVELIAELERQLHGQRSRVERIGQAIARSFGSVNFIIVHVLVITAWILWNTGSISGLQPFDPYPFGLLSLVIGLEFILLTTFVLMNQKHQIRRTEQWGHLDLQLSMLTEQEVTKNLQMLRQICDHLGIRVAGTDEEIEELAQGTQVAALADEIGKIREGDSTLAE